MVKQGDFEIELVHADSKVPFKEHEKDGKVYVEVEPDAEYYISVKRIGRNHDGSLMVQYLVDDQDLGYHTTFHKIDEEPDYSGVWNLLISINCSTSSTR